MNNQIILQQLREGRNGEALKSLYEIFPAVRQFIKLHGGDEDDARDVFQEALIIFYRNALKPDFELTSAVGTYLFSVVKFRWKDELKKKNRIVSFEIELRDEAQDAVDAHRENESRFRMLEKIVDTLGDKCREILTLFYYGRKSMEEIADQLGYKNVDTVKTQKYKCIERSKSMARELMVSNLTTEV